MGITRKMKTSSNAQQASKLTTHRQMSKKRIETTELKLRTTRMTRGKNSKILGLIYRTWTLLFLALITKMMPSPLQDSSKTFYVNNLVVNSRSIQLSGSLKRLEPIYTEKMISLFLTNWRKCSNQKVNLSTSYIWLQATSRSNLLPHKSMRMKESHSSKKKRIQYQESHQWLMLSMHLALEIWIWVMTTTIRWTC